MSPFAAPAADGCFFNPGARGTRGAHVPRARHRYRTGRTSPPARAFSRPRLARSRAFPDGSPLLEPSPDPQRGARGASASCGAPRAQSLPRTVARCHGTAPRAGTSARAGGRLRHCAPGWRGSWRRFHQRRTAACCSLQHLLQLPLSDGETASRTRGKQGFDRNPAARLQDKLQPGRVMAQVF